MKTLAALLALAAAYPFSAAAEEISEGTAASVRGGLNDFNKKRAASPEAGAPPKPAPPKAAFATTEAIDAATTRYRRDITLVNHVGPKEIQIHFLEVDGKQEPKHHRQNSVYKKEGELWRLDSGWDLVKEHEAAKEAEEAEAAARANLPLVEINIGPAGAPAAPAAAPAAPHRASEASVGAAHAAGKVDEVMDLMDSSDPMQDWRRKPAPAP